MDFQPKKSSSYKDPPEFSNLFFSLWEILQVDDSAAISKKNFSVEERKELFCFEHFVHFFMISYLEKFLRPASRRREK